MHFSYGSFLKSPIAIPGWRAYPAQQYVVPCERSQSDMHRPAPLRPAKAIIASGSTPRAAVLRSSAGQLPVRTPCLSIACELQAGVRGQATSYPKTNTNNFDRTSALAASGRRGDGGRSTSHVPQDGNITANKCTVGPAGSHGANSFAPPPRGTTLATQPIRTSKPAVIPDTGSSCTQPPLAAPPPPPPKQQQHLQQRHPASLRPAPPQPMQPSPSPPASPPARSMMAGGGSRPATTQQAPPCPAAAPSPLADGVGPPAGSVMAGWSLAGGQPTRNSVYRLIRKKELQQQYHHHPHQRHFAGETDPRDGHTAGSNTSINSGSEQLKQQWQQQSPELSSQARFSSDGPGGGLSYAAGASSNSSISRHRRRSGNGKTVRSSDGSGVSRSRDMEDRVGAASSAGSERYQHHHHHHSQREGLTSDIEVTWAHPLPSPPPPPHGAAGLPGYGANGGDGGSSTAGANGGVRSGGSCRAPGGSSSSSSLVQEALTSDHAARNPVYRMIRKHELLQRHSSSSGSSSQGSRGSHPSSQRQQQQWQEARADSKHRRRYRGRQLPDLEGGRDLSRAAATAEIQQDSASNDPWIVDDDFACDVMLQGIVAPTVQATRPLLLPPHQGQDQDAEQLGLGQLQDAEQLRLGQLQDAERLGLGQLQDAERLGLGQLQDAEQLGLGQLQDAERLGLGQLQDAERLGLGQLQDAERLGLGQLQDAEQLGLHAEEGEEQGEQQREGPEEEEEASWEERRRWSNSGLGLNPVLRLIRKKQLQRRLRLRGGAAGATGVAVAAGEGPPTTRPPPPSGPPPSLPSPPAALEAEGAAAAAGGEGIGPGDAVGGRAVMNHVYRLIRKKQLQRRRAARAADAAAGAAAASLAEEWTTGQSLSPSSSSMRSPSSFLPNWHQPLNQPLQQQQYGLRSAPFFDLDLGFLGPGSSTSPPPPSSLQFFDPWPYGGLSSPPSPSPGVMLAEALDPGVMQPGQGFLDGNAAANASSFGGEALGGPIYGSEAHWAGHEGRQHRGANVEPPPPLVLDVTLAAAAEEEEEDTVRHDVVRQRLFHNSSGNSHLDSPPAPLPLVSDDLAAWMVGERPRMNAVYRLIRKKELQLRHRRQHHDGGGSGGSGSSTTWEHGQKQEMAAEEKQKPSKPAAAPTEGAATAPPPPVTFPLAAPAAPGACELTSPSEPTAAATAGDDAHSLHPLGAAQVDQRGLASEPAGTPAALPEGEGAGLAQPPPKATVAQQQPQEEVEVEVAPSLGTAPGVDGKRAAEGVRRKGRRAGARPPRAGGAPSPPDAYPDSYQREQWQQERQGGAAGAVEVRHGPPPQQPSVVSDVGVGLSSENVLEEHEKEAEAEGSSRLQKMEALKASIRAKLLASTSTATSSTPPPLPPAAPPPSQRRKQQAPSLTPLQSGLLSFLRDTEPTAAAIATTAAAVSQRQRDPPDPSGHHDAGGDGAASSGSSSGRHPTATKPPPPPPSRTTQQQQVLPYSGIAQMWAEVGIRVGLQPQGAHGGGRRRRAAGGGQQQEEETMEEVLERAGVDASTAERLASSPVLLTRGWAAEEVLRRLRGLQLVLAGSPPPLHRNAGSEKGEDKDDEGGDPYDDGEGEEDGGDGDGDGVVRSLAQAARVAARQPNLLTRQAGALAANLGALGAVLGLEGPAVRQLVSRWPFLLELRASLLPDRLSRLAVELGLG
ncbi:hypothetical protein Agub_g13373, partial [Astrephomene gubernaculifera]